MQLPSSQLLTYWFYIAASDVTSDVWSTWNWIQQKQMSTRMQIRSEKNAIRIWPNLIRMMWSFGGVLE